MLYYILSFAPQSNWRNPLLEKIFICESTKFGIARLVKICEDINHALITILIFINVKF
jgi:hypothetical protein